MKPPLEAFTIEVAVKPDDIDQLKHVNNTVYVRWMQDVAVSHWNTAAPAAVRAAMFWVVRRHEIDYVYSAKLGDTVVVRTWIGQESDGYFERFTQMSRAKDGRTLTRARSLWAPMDMTTGTRLRNVPDGVRAQWTAPAVSERA